MAPEESDDERCARAGEAEFARRAGVPTSNVAQRWWFFPAVSASLWLRVLSWPFQDHRDHANNVVALLSLLLLALFVVLGVKVWRQRTRQ